jgi:hypothetical protein
LELAGADTGPAVRERLVASFPRGSELSSALTD